MKHSSLHTTPTNKHTTFFQKNETIIVLAILFLFGLFLRWFRFDQGFIFAYDQARDAYRSLSIYTQHHLMILGPETDINGVFHGVGFYYMLGLFYWIFHNPSVVGKLFALLNAGGIILTYFGGLVLFQNKRTALISALLYTISFEVVQYARWLSNPAPALLAVMVVYLGSWIWIKGNQKGLLLSVAGIGLGMHFQFILIYLLLVPVVVWFFYKPKTSIRTLIWAVGIFSILMSTFIVAELKFGFPMAKGLWSYFFGHEKRAFDAYQTLLRLWTRSSSAVYFTLFPISRIIAILLQIGMFFVGLLWYKKDKKTLTAAHPFGFLMLWYFLIFPLYRFSAGASNSEFSFVNSIPALLFIAAYCIEKLLQDNKTKVLAAIMLAVIVLLHVRINIAQADRGSYIFVTHIGMTYSQEKALIDYVYKTANTEQFSLCTMTNPLFINTAWSYLFSTYGKSTYGYTPYWSGSDQTNYLGGNDLTPDTKKPRLRFLIAELSGIPDSARRHIFTLENYISTSVERKQFGSITVEKRILKPADEIGKPAAAYQKVLNADAVQYSCYH